MNRDSNIYGTVVKKTMMAEDYSTDKRCRHEPSTVHHTSKWPHWSSTLVLTAASITLGGSIPAGYLGGAGINPHHVEDRWITLSSATLRTLLLLGGLAGSPVALCLTDLVGRKKAMVVGNIFGVSGAVLHITASLMQSDTLLVAAWITFGICLGASVVAVPLYLIELAPPRLRPSLGAVFTVGATVGALLSQIVSLYCTLGSQSAHPLFLPMFVIPIFVSWFLLPQVPESPMFLFFIKKDRQLAAEELASLRGIDTRSAENELLQHPNISNQSIDEEAGWRQIIQQPTLVLLVCAAHLAQALAGADQVYHLSTAKSKLPEVDVVAAGYIASVANCITALVLVQLISTVSWQTLLIVSSVISALFFIVLAAIAFLAPNNSDMEYLVLIILLLQVIVFDLGLRAIPYFLACELFDTNASATIMAVGAAANFIGQMLSDQLFTHLGVAQSRFISSLSLALFTILLLFIPMPEMNKTVHFTNESLQKRERRISYLPNPHRNPGDTDRYRRKSEERRSSQTF